MALRIEECISCYMPSAKNEVVRLLDDVDAREASRSMR
jgi:hypothetical protein